jgi:hypothetical protein
MAISEAVINIGLADWRIKHVWGDIGIKRDLPGHNAQDLLQVRLASMD